MQEVVNSVGPPRSPTNSGLGGWLQKRLSPEHLQHAVGLSRTFQIPQHRRHRGDQGRVIGKDPQPDEAVPRLLILCLQGPQAQMQRRLQPGLALPSPGRVFQILQGAHLLFHRPQ